MVFGLSFLFFCCGILGRKWKSCTPVYLLQPERRNDERLSLFLFYILCVFFWVSLKCIAQLGHLEYIFFHSHLCLKFLHLLDVWYFLIKFVYIPTNIDNNFGTKLHQKWITHLLWTICLYSKFGQCLQGLLSTIAGGLLICI